jgi:hypothetical protein
MAVATIIVVFIGVAFLFRLSTFKHSISCGMNQSKAGLNGALLKISLRIVQNLRGSRSK